MRMPSPVLPVIVLPSPAEVPPIVIASAPVSLAMAMPLPSKPVIARLRTADEPSGTSNRRPSVSPPAVDPSSTTPGAEPISSPAPSMVSASVIVGRGEAGVMMCGPVSGMSNVMMSAPGVSFAWMIAWRRVRSSGATSAVVVTAHVAARAGVGVTVRRTDAATMPARITATNRQPDCCPWMVDTKRPVTDRC